MNRLIEHAQGNNDMTSTQVKAAETVLRKILPDLQAVQEVHEEDFSALTRDELEARIKELTNKRPELSILAGANKVVKTIEHDIDIENTDNDDNDD